MGRDFCPNDTACRKCKARMRNTPPVTGRLAGTAFQTTAYRCTCGHWNDLRSRKANRTARPRGEKEGAHGR